MKKIILFIILVLFLSGCESKEEYFTKVCTNKIVSNDLKDSLEEKVTYNNKDEVKNIEIVRNYESENKQVIGYVKKSLENYNNDLLKNKNITINIVTDEDNLYALRYVYNVDKMDKKELDVLGINKNSIKYLKRLKKEGLSCKGA